MGFPSPAADYVETRISLDQQLISHPAATYLMRASSSHFREGILQGALLVVDASLSPCDGSLLICAIDGEFRIKRYRTQPELLLIIMENGRCYQKIIMTAQLCNHITVKKGNFASV